MEKDEIDKDMEDWVLGWEAGSRIGGLRQTLSPFDDGNRQFNRGMQAQAVERFGAYHTERERLEYPNGLCECHWCTRTRGAATPYDGIHHDQCACRRCRSGILGWLWVWINKERY